MVISASEIPFEMPARPPEVPPALIAANDCTIPIVVPSSPTNGAVEPTVARMPRPRLNSESTISIWRSTARSAELMSAAVIVARSRSNGFTSWSAPPSTRETWLPWFFSESVMAWSSCSSWMARENWGANLRVASVLFRTCQSLFSAMVSEKNDMMRSTMTMPLAKGPASCHRPMISTPMLVVLLQQEKGY